MDTLAPAWNAQAGAWRLLKGLRPRPLDLDRIGLIRGMAPDELRSPFRLEALIPQLGLNDEGLAEFPAHLHGAASGGLRIWQYPTQFSEYLAQLIRLDVRSYLELGIRHGGSFVATVEVLERFRPLDFAVGVDIIDCPSMTDYKALNPRSEFVRINTQSDDFQRLLDRLAPIDLVFIDSHHEEHQCRREFAALAGRANMIALHDISNKGCPGIATVWQEIRATAGWTCFEFTQQYADLGPYMGIGLAVRTDRMGNT
ncbi:MAG: CmcI family methyltransferase [Burkholderiaceae bacterium]|nr:CmcI family methyltransferase [Burkholderiaceae bacterium]